jgi:predicted phage replisome organizer
MKRYYWLKLKDDFFTQKAIKKLRRIAGGDTFTIIYLKMMLIAMKSDGRIYFEGIESSFYEELALELDEEEENVNLTIRYLLTHKLIEESENEYFIPESVNNTGSETDSAERVRRLRQKTLQCNDKVLQSNSDVTTSNEDVTKCNVEKRREEKELDIRVDNKLIFESYTQNIELIETLKSFIEFRKSIKAKMSDHAINLLLKNLDKLTESDNEKIEILNQSIVNGYKGVFPIKNNNVKMFEKTNKKSIPHYKSVNEEVSDEEFEEMLKLAKELEEA